MQQTDMNAACIAELGWGVIVIAVLPVACSGLRLATCRQNDINGDYVTELAL
jgi:hypothetical protein